MSKKALLKTTAIVVCFAFLLLSSPGLTLAKTHATKFDFNKIIKKPVAFFSSLLSFLPINDSGTSVESDRSSGNKTNGELKVTGDLNCGRASDGD